jgi:hypothetical protein
MSQISSRSLVYKRCDAINTQEHGLAIKDELLGSDTSGGLDDQRIAARPVVAVAGVKPDPVAVARDDQPIAVLFDLVDPVRVRGDFCAAGGDAGKKLVFVHVSWAWSRTRRRIYGRPAKSCANTASRGLLLLRKRR